MFPRREFLQRSAALIASSTVFNSLYSTDLFAADSLTTAKAEMPEISLFTKHFLGLSYDRLAEVVAGLGITGIEAPVRPGGHVEPAAVEEELPKLVEALKKCGVRITMLTSGINSVDKASNTEVVLRTAKALGIPRYRMNWYYYDNQKPIWPQFDSIRPKLKDLVSFSKEIEILPCYQNHSGAKDVGAGIWDIAFLMRDYPSNELAWAFDIMHATIEGSSSWPTEFALVRDHLEMAYFKNFNWEGKGHKPVPLAEGIVGRDYVSLLKKSGFRGPVSLHVEYLKGRVTDAAYLETAVAATKRDLATLREWWA